MPVELGLHTWQYHPPWPSTWPAILGGMLWKDSALHYWCEELIRITKLEQESDSIEGLPVISWN